MTPVTRTFARARYYAQQHGFAVSLGLFARALRALSPAKVPNPPPATVKALVTRFRQLIDDDWRHAAAGTYPARLLFDFDAREFVRTLPLAIADIPKTVARVKRRDHDDLPASVARENYPDYYLRNFHWQTDGWFSERSARLYDFGVDVLFGGTTDAMRRMTLPPVVAALRGQPGAKVLDVACGTGRFVEQLVAALPGASVTGVDLSPAYVARARERLAGKADFVEANAETLPFPDASFDAVTSVFLFHELPKDVRRTAFREMRRVLKPGGTLAICDSAQYRESEEIRFVLDAFPRNYHEPYYKSYLMDPIEDALVEAGFDDVRGKAHFVAKVVSARKPTATA